MNPTEIISKLSGIAGGRKGTLIWVVLILSLLNEWVGLGLTEKDIENLIFLTLTGTGIIAAEDLGKHLGTNGNGTAKPTA